MDNESFTFPCPHCGQPLEAESDWAGMELNCIYCGKPLTVPSPMGRHASGVSLPNGAQPPIIQTIVKGGDETPPVTPVITVVEKRESIFAKNRKWLIPAAGAAVAVVLLMVWIGAAKRGGHSPSQAVPSVTTGHPQGQDHTAPPPQHRTFSGARKFVKEHIDKNDNCRIVAITKTNGDVVVCGNNNWASSNCPRLLNEALQKVADASEKIIDVCLTEGGRYIVLYGRNAAYWNDIPYDMERNLRLLNGGNEQLYSATLNDGGDWIVVGSEHYACSATWLKAWLAGGAEKYGILRAAAVSTDAAVACFDGGYLFMGNVPEDLKDALRKATFDVRIIKIAGSAWFFASEYGYSYNYNM